MQDAAKQEALRESRKALDLMAKSVLTAEEQQAVVADCVTNFDQYVNPGILEYRKSVSTDYTSVEWTDEGSVFYDIHGKEYIDCLGGFGIYMLGHRHPTVVKAVRDQLEHQALHSQELLDPMRGYLSHLLAMTTPGDLRYSFFCNSGTEANEGAMKLAKLWARRKKPNHTLGIIATTRGFHGKSFGSLSVSGKGEFREPFYPLMPGVRFVPYGDADALDKQLGHLRRRSASTSPPSSRSPCRVRRARSSRRPTTSPRCARSATSGASSSSPTRCRRAWAAPASSGAWSTGASRPTS